MRLVVTKLDLPAVRERFPAIRAELGTDATEPLGVSAHDGTGMDALRAEVGRALDEAAPLQALRHEDEDAVRVHRFDPAAEGWSVLADREGLRVVGRRIEAAANRTDFENEESRERFDRLLERLGIGEELRRRGIEAGTTVRIGRAELEWGDE
jgi:GTP-binding protein